MSTSSRSRVTTLLVMMLAVLCLAPQAQSRSLTLDATATGAPHALGEGVNTLLGQSELLAVQPTRIDTTNFDVTSADAQYSTTASEMFSKMGLTAEASFNYGLYAGDLSTSLQSETAQSFTSSNLAVVVSVKTKVLDVLEGGLVPTAQTARRHPVIFIQNFGDSWLKSQTYGGLCLIVMHFESSSQSQKDQLDAALKGGFGHGMASLSGSLTKLDQLQTQSTATSVHVYAVGTTVPATAQTSIDSALAWAQKFPQLVSDAGGQLTEVTLSDYQTSLAGRNGMGQWAAQLQATGIDRACLNYRRDTELLATLDDVLAHMNEYPPNSIGKDISDTRDAIGAALTTFVNEIQLPHGGRQAPELLVPAIAIPKRCAKYDIQVRQCWQHLGMPVPYLRHIYVRGNWKRDNPNGPQYPMGSHDVLVWTPDTHLQDNENEAWQYSGIHDVPADHDLRVRVFDDCSLLGDNWADPNDMPTAWVW